MIAAKAYRLWLTEVSPVYQTILALHDLRSGFALTPYSSARPARDKPGDTHLQAAYQYLTAIAPTRRNGNSISCQGFNPRWPCKAEVFVLQRQVWAVSWIPQ